MKKILTGLLMVATLLLVVACGNEPKKEGQGKKTLDTVSIGYMPNYSSINLVAAGIVGGYFEEEGIDIKLVEFADGPTIVSAMESGSINVGNIGPGAHVLPPQGKAEIISMSQFGNADEVIGNKTKGVNSIADLKGKTIANASGTSSETILNLTLKEAGLTVDDVKIVDMDAAAITTAMLSGGVDAAATWSPNTHTIRSQMGDDVVMLTNNERYIDQYPSISSWATAPGYVKDNHDLMVRFMRALLKGMDYRVENDKEVAKWVAKQLAVDEDSVLQQLNDATWFTSAEMVQQAEDGTMLKLYNKQKDNFIERGQIEEKGSLDAKEFVLVDLILEAAKK